MMKHLATVFLSIFCFHFLSAQAQIDPSWLPVPGDEWVFVVNGNPGVIDEGPSGSNITWDYKNFVFSSGPLVSLTWVDPANTPYYDEFPGATHAMQDNSFNNHFNYYKATNNGLEYMGNKSEVIMDDPVTTHYTPYRPYIPYLGYLDTVREFYSSYSESKNYMKEVEGYTYILYDGYGSLLTSNHTFPDVIRLQRYEVFLDSTEIGNILIVEWEVVSNYIWMEEGSAKPIAYFHNFSLRDSTYNNGVLIDHNESNVSTFVYSFEIATASEQALQSADFMIYPNRAIEQVIIAAEEIPAGTEFQVFNMQAQPMHQGVLSGDKTRLDIAHLPAGRYFVRVGKMGNTKSFIKVE